MRCLAPAIDHPSSSSDSLIRSSLFLYLYGCWGNEGVYIKDLLPGQKMKTKINLPCGPEVDGGQEVIYKEEEVAGGQKVLHKQEDINGSEKGGHKVYFYKKEELRKSVDGGHKVIDKEDKVEGSVDGGH